MRVTQSGLEGRRPIGSVGSVLSLLKQVSVPIHPRQLGMRRLDEGHV
jgi:hypothetical protein